MKVSHRFVEGSAKFDENNIVSCAGLVPVMTLAQETRLQELITQKVSVEASKVASGAANPAPKLATLIAGMCAGADSIDDVNILRSGGMKHLFGNVYAPSTVGTLMRELTFGHNRQLESVLRDHVVELADRVEILPGLTELAFIDIDSLLRPVYGHGKQGASYRHTKIAGKQLLRKGLSPLATTITTAGSAPVLAGMRLRAGKAGSGKGAGRMVTQAINTARMAGASGMILVRGDSAYGNSSVVGACRRKGVEFSVVMVKNTAVQHAIDTISDDAWTPVHYPGAVRDPDNGGWISDAEVAETTYTAFSSTNKPVTARLIVRRVKALPRCVVPGLAVSPLLHQHHTADDDRRCHPPRARHHRNRLRGSDRWTTRTPALGPLRGQRRMDPLRRDRPQPARAAGIPAGDQHSRARGATLRRRLVNVAARLTRPQRRPVLRLPTHWPWSSAWLRLWTNTIGHSPPATA